MDCGTNVWVWEFAFNFWKWLGIPIGVYILFNPTIIQTVFFWLPWLYTIQYMEIQSIFIGITCIVFSLILWIFIIDSHIDKLRSRHNTPK